MTGIVCLWKPEDMTSFQAVRRVRTLTGEKKAGHCGTLDPMATGVLPVMLGGATRFLDFLPTTPKQYRAVLKLGVKTDTLDRTGTVLKTCPVTQTREDLLSVLPQFVGDISQVPPMYSAIKKDGVRMYELARQGLEVEREARTVTIYSLDLLPDGTDGTHPEEGEYVLDVTCSGGTYIRTLIDDLGDALSCGATMQALTRTKVGVFEETRAVTPEALEEAVKNGTLSDHLVPLEEALSFLPAVTVTAPQANRFQNGGGLFLDRLHSLSETPSGGALYRVLSSDGNFLGLGETDREQNLLSVKRVFVNR